MRNRTLVALVTFASLVLVAGQIDAQVWEVNDHLLRLDSLQTSAHFGRALAVGDFDDDGDNDLAVGAPYWNSPAAADAGLCWVYFSGPGRSLVSQNGWYVGGTDSNLTGWALAAGDFDANGRDEIALGRPGADTGGLVSSGAVSIMEYSSGGWHFTKTLDQEDTVDETSPETDDQFGRRLAVGNFNGDAYDDLAVGVPLEDVGPDADTGAVQVFYGGVSGLRTDNDATRWPLVGGPGQQYGFSLAVGDFDDDGYDDLAVGAPYRTVGEAVSAGAVEIWFGSAGGLEVGGRQTLTDLTFGFNANSEDYFGWSLAAGNFNQTPISCLVGTCYEDLAIGVPGQLITNDNAGKVMVGYGGAAGIRVDNATYLEPGTFGAAPELDDWFGYSLASGYLDRSASAFQRYADLAVGTRYEDTLATDNGYVHLVFGASGGVDAGLPQQALDQSTGFAIAPAEDYDYWGEVLRIADLDGDGWGDLIVGVPYKNLSGVANTGAVEVLYGALFADGFESNGTTNW